MKADTVEKIGELARIAAERHDCELFLLEPVDAGRHSVIRVFIDREGGVGIDDCTHVSRELSVLLDVEDVIPSKYTLEVSSPGINRPLRGPDDFVRFVGSKVKVVTHRAVGDGGQKTFLGTLHGYENETAVILTSKGEVRIAQDNVKRANLEFDFSN